MRTKPGRRPTRIHDIAIEWVEAHIDPLPLARFPPLGGPVLERHRHRPIAQGLQIQNFDDDDRSGLVDKGDAPWSSPR